MTKFENWFMKRIIRKEVIQGYDHPNRISNLYRMIRDAAKEEFTEDNKVTLDSNLTEWFNDTLGEH